MKLYRYRLMNNIFLNIRYSFLIALRLINIVKYNLTSSYKKLLLLLYTMQLLFKIFFSLYVTNDLQIAGCV